MRGVAVTETLYLRLRVQPRDERESRWRGGGTVGGVGRSGHAGAGDQATSHDRIRVCVRKRPLSEKELARDNKDIIRCNPVTGNYFSRVVYAVPVTSLLVTLSSAFT